MKKYPIFVGIGICLWIGENIYFGWNAQPINNIEAGFDVISNVLIIWGIIGDLLSNITIQKGNNYFSINDSTTPTTSN